MPIAQLKIKKEYDKIKMDPKKEKKKSEKRSEILKTI